MAPNKDASEQDELAVESAGRREALKTLESVQSFLFEDLAKQVGSIEGYDPTRAGTLHGWFANRGGQAEEALKAPFNNDIAARLDPATLKDRAERFGVPVDFLRDREAMIRKRMGIPTAKVDSLLTTAASDRSTRYTDPWWFARLEQLSRALFAARDAHFVPPHPLANAHPTRDEIVFGTFPGVQVNARAMRVVEDRYRIILIDETVFVFSFVLGQLFSAALFQNGLETWSLDRQKRAVHLAQHSEISKQAVALYKTYLLEGHLKHLVALKFDAAREASIAVLVTAAQLFFVGHEIAHCFQPKGNDWKPPRGLEGVKLTEWQREFDADITGLQLAIFAGEDQGWGAELVVQATLQLLYGLAKLEEALTQFRETAQDDKKQKELENTHPPFRDRYNLLFAGAEHLVPAERADAVRQLITENERLMEDVLAPVPAAMSLEVEAGRKVNPIWKVT